MSAKRGSALLIVLGMLSFMVVSAVGFSMFMRQSRLPSSYLRRNVASRYLVKAALANAIEELDGGLMSLYDIGEGDGSRDEDYTTGRFFGIFDDPYPGVGPESGETQLQQGERIVNNSDKLSFCKNGDMWLKRVFCPFGPLPTPRSEAEAVNRLPLTVPTMTLEGLAYLPPAIIDDVRLVSRMTRTAQWRTLPYEAGRYAYTAVNVSDLFDINLLRAGAPRDSGINRITLASLCSTDKQNPFQIDDSSVNLLDQVLDSIDNCSFKFSNAQGENRPVPFLSMADFNYFACQQDSGYAYTPFMGYVGGSSSSLLQNNPKTANAMFITDSWFPPTNSPSAGVVYDLAGGHQPFKDFTADCALQVTLRKNPQDSAGDIFERNLGPGLMCLYDYLDSDSKPISLAFPTTEAVPMVVAVGAPIGFQPQFVKDTSTKSAVQTVNGYTYDVTRTVTKYSISSFEAANQVIVNAAVMYPFKRMKQTKRFNNIQFKARAVMRVFLVPEQTVRTAYFDSRPSRPVAADLSLSDPTAFNANTMSYMRGIATFASDQVDLAFFNEDMVKQDDKKWIKDVQFTFSTAGINLAVVQKVHEDWQEKVQTGQQSSAPVITKPDAFTLDGAIDSYDQQQPPSFRGVLTAVTDRGELADEANWYSGAATVNNQNVREPGTTANPTLDNVTPFSDNTSYKLFTAVWVQITDASGNEVYDMAPACFNDDDVWLKASGSANPSMTFGEGSPLLTFITDYPAFMITDMPDAFQAAATFANDKTALYVPDPRFNHAPENWFYLTSGETGLADKWCTAMGAVGGTSDVFGKDGHDRDVFMFVSDQEYLQDIGELQFLPALHDMTGMGAMINDPQYSAGTLCDGRYYVDGTSGIVDGGGVFKNGNNGFMDCDYFWRTYNAYDTGLGDPYPIYALPFTTGNAGGIRFHSGVRRFKVNPYSDDNRVLSAAIAGTPFDYYVASTNVNQLDSAQRTCKKNLMSAMENSVEDYTFCDQCEAAKFSESEMQDVLDRLRNKIRQSASSTRGWEETWGQLGWQPIAPANIGDANTALLGDVLIEQVLHGVDRKFLYSFWRECFDNRQQLFLIFVRAEPSAIGGGAAGNISSAQLGGRAVALVWRDPQPIGGMTGRPARPNGTLNPQSFRQTYKANLAPHRTRVLFYHQFD